MSHFLRHFYINTCRSNSLCCFLDKLVRFGSIDIFSEMVGYDRVGLVTVRKRRQVGTRLGVCLF